MRSKTSCPRTQVPLAEASEIVWAGVRLRSDIKIVRWPDRYMDERGREFWGQLMALLPVERELNRNAASGYFFLGSAGDPRSSHVSLS